MFLVKWLTEGALLDKPWRQLTFDVQTRTQLLDEIKQYETLTDGVTDPKILLIGQTKAGKSSFFNSVNSVFRGYPIFQATSSQWQKNVSKHCRTYAVMDTKGGKRLPFTFCDIMGLDPSSEELGIQVQDIIKVIRGDIPDNYKFDPKQAKDVCKTCDEQSSLADKVHCIVYVIDTSAASLLQKQLQNMFQTIHEEAHKMGIPQLALLTKVDLACNIVKDDLSKVYKSRCIQKKVLEVWDLVGVPASCVLPVRNYWIETELDMNVDILILKALQQILRQADAYFDEIKQRGKSKETHEPNCEAMP